jgi:2-methylisocitrate lyase-like PEP mutase family enzyme
MTFAKDIAKDSADRFRSLHRSGSPLVLPNAWDVASARLVEDAGAPAVATSSAGVAWSLGAPDGDRLGRDLVLDLIARVAAAVRVPVTADIENGYATEPAGVAETIRGVIAAGAVGVNLEDVTYEAGEPALKPVEAQTERIAAARQAAGAAGVPLYLNARTDIYLLGVGEPETRLPATLERAAAYLAAGADGIFVPGTTNPETVSALVKGIDAPVNILAGPGSPSIGELAALGVARVSIGSKLAATAYAAARRAAEELLGGGTYGGLAGALDFGQLNALLAAGDKLAGAGPASDLPVPRRYG